MKTATELVDALRERQRAFEETAALFTPPDADMQEHALLMKEAADYIWAHSGLPAEAVRDIQAMRDSIPTVPFGVKACDLPPLPGDDGRKAK